jgi:hypothetical protein
MSLLHLPPAEFEYILNCCQRVLVKEFTQVADLKHFLVARLGDDYPVAAASVEQLTDEQMHDLASLCATVRDEAPSVLWR